MESRQLGRMGPLVSCLGLGGMSIAGAYGHTDENEALEVLDRAYDLGIDHFDTADIYGMGLSEELLATFLRTRRRRVTVATKGSIRFIRATGERRIDNSPVYLRKAVDASLRRLGCDYVDLYYLHRREAGRDICESVAALAELKREGKIRAIGLSEVSPETLRRAHDEHPIAAVQSEYSLWTRNPEEGMLQACRELGVAFVAFSPLGRGIFADHEYCPHKSDGSDFRKRNPRFSADNYPKNFKAVRDYFVRLAQERGVKPATLALAWVLGQGDHVHAIPGTRFSSRLEDFVAAADIKLTAEEAREIADGFPDGFPWGERYSEVQRLGVEDYSRALQG